MTTSLKRGNVVLLLVIFLGLFFFYTISRGPCAWRRFHKLWWETANVPVFVTGGNSKTYQESKRFLQDLYRFQNSRYWGMQVVYIDLGLTPDQILDLADICFQCECEFKQIPMLTRILKSTEVESGFTEAVIIKTILEEYPFLMWIDSSTKLNSSNLITDLFQKTINNGLQVAVGNDRVDGEFGLKSDQFKLIDENPIYYTSMPSVDTSWILLHELEPRVDIVLKQYFSCVENSVCLRRIKQGKVCKSNRVKFSVKQCRAILTVKLIKEFDQCYRSFAFSRESYVLNDNPMCIK